MIKDVFQIQITFKAEFVDDENRSNHCVNGEKLIPVSPSYIEHSLEPFSWRKESPTTFLDKRKYVKHSVKLFGPSQPKCSDAFQPRKDDICPEDDKKPRTHGWC